MHANFANWLVAIISMVALLGCDHVDDDREVVVYSSVDRVFAEPVLKEFETKSGIRVRAVFDTEESKSTGVLNRLIAEAANPRADVFWSGDPMRPFQLIRRDLVAPYAASEASDVAAFAAVANHQWTPVAARARVILLNTQLVPDDAPNSIADLANPKWKDRAAIANPLFGTTTMHVAALFESWGDERAKQFLNDLKANGVRIAASNGEVKRLVSAGEVAWGVTDTDDANDAVRSGAPVRVIFPDQDGVGALVMPTSAVLLKGSPHPAEGQRLLDYLASAPVETYLAAHGAHLPLRNDVAAPAALAVPKDLKVMTVNYQDLAATIERIQPWLRDWAGL